MEEEEGEEESSSLARPPALQPVGGWVGGKRIPPPGGTWMPSTSFHSTPSLAVAVAYTVYHIKPSDLYFWRHFTNLLFSKKIRLEHAILLWALSKNNFFCMAA